MMDKLKPELVRPGRSPSLPREDLAIRHTSSTNRNATPDAQLIIRDLSTRCGRHESRASDDLPKVRSTNTRPRLRPLLARPFASCPANNLAQRAQTSSQSSQ